MGRNSPDQTRGKALDLWQAPAGAGEPLVCVVTSFTFDAAFFETECVGRFLQMDTHPSESDAIGYLIEREEKLAAAKVCALVDRRHARDKESLRWDVLGVLVPRAIQHAKVALLAWGNCVRVIVGSGNLTEPGYRKNLEIFGTIELSKTDGGDRNSVEKTIEFLEQVANLAVGTDDPDTPKERVRHALAAVRRHTDGWPSTSADIQTAVPIFGLPGRSVLDQFSAEWPSGGPARTASIVSPFFDRPGQNHEAMKALIAQMAKKRPRDIYLYIRAEDRPDGKTRVYAPLEMLKSARRTCDVHVHTVLRVQKEEVRELHAKLLRLENDHWQMLLAGSSNFTSAGLAGAPGRGNFEANLVYRMKTSDRQFRRFEALWPDTSQDELDLDSPMLIWDPEPEELEDGVDKLPLPASFQDAIFVPGKDPSLRISLTPGLPQTWSIRVPNGTELLSSTLRTGAGQHILAWVASSFEAYSDTRAGRDARDEDVDAGDVEVSPELEWYLTHLDRALPKGSQEIRSAHPKVRATAERAVALWRAGEKVLIFCHYRATGRALRQHISALLDKEIVRLGQARLPGLSQADVQRTLEEIGERFFKDEGLRTVVTDWLRSIVRAFTGLSEEHANSLIDIVRRFIRTPSFLVRYLPLQTDDMVQAFLNAFEAADDGQQSLRQSVEHFCRFLAERCIESERADFLAALEKVQTGSHFGKDVRDVFDPAEAFGLRDDAGAALLPNVRLANGQVRAETRLRLLLTFNTPLFPEILIASSVLAEGVDLHLNCRYVIHHDLCWNPSTLEQRSGRVDRIGSKAERVKKSIHLFIPYVAATQDEKMFRVVRDRERWFQIIMGEKYDVDEASTDRQAARVLLPRKVQQELAMRLHP